MIEKIEFQWLLSFQAVYKHLSFKSAAAQLQLPTSNVSRHVALLEQQLNVRLLERTTRKMIPTAVGIQLYESTTPLTQSVNEALEEIFLQGDTVTGHLKIILPDLPFMADIIADFCFKNPRIQLSCDTQINPSQGLLDGFDLVLTFGRGLMGDSGWVAKEILRWPSSVVAAPALLETHSIPHTLDELSKSPCITSLSVLQGMPWRFKHNQTLQVQAHYKVNSGNIAKAAAIRGLGFAILPIHACQTDIERGSLVRVNLECEPEDLVLYAFYSGRKYPLERVKVFLEHLRIGVAELGEIGQGVQ
jgi:DNA-binding transcriptional LysR family regulator